MNSSLAERFCLILVLMICQRILTDKHDFIDCGASLKPSSIKNPRDSPLGKKIEGRKEYTYDTC